MQSHEQQPHPLEGLLVVEAYQDEDGTVDIYTVRSGELVLLESGGEQFARTWLCHHARRLVSWKPRRLHDDLSGIWCRLSPTFQEAPSQPVSPGMLPIVSPCDRLCHLWSSILSMMIKRSSVYDQGVIQVKTQSAIFVVLMLSHAMRAIR